MPKPQTRDGYTEAVTRSCERVLVTLISELGPWRDSVFLVGGLIPRYLVPQGADVPPHAGTTDVDVVIDQAILADTEAYATLEANLKKMGFERAENDEGKKVSWRWKTHVDGATMVLEFLADAPELVGRKVRPLPTKGNISALNIPHSSMVFDLHESREVTAEKIGARGVTTQTIRHADIVSLTCLKIFAFADRAEPKDAHDLVYCLEHFAGGLDAIAPRFQDALAHAVHGPAVRAALDHLRRCFGSTGDVEGYTRDGPVAVARFEWGDEAESRESRILRQRQASALIEELLARVG